MFKKILGNQKKSFIQETSNSFDLNSLTEAKDKAKETYNNDFQENLNEENDKIFKEGLLYFCRFIKNTDNRDNLKKAIDKFTEYTEIEKNNYESYYYLAYIAYICNDNKLAYKYIHIADLINPNSEKVIKLKNKIGV